MSLLTKITSVTALSFQVWFWLVQLPPFVVAFFVLDTEAFARLTLLYLGVVTIITASLSALSSLVAARVEVRQEEDADVQEVLDAVEELSDKE